MSKTQRLIPAAVVQADEYSCLVLRGIPPSRYTEIKPEYLPRGDLKLALVNEPPDPITWGSDLYFGDASGAEFTSISTLRRVDCGLAAVHSKGELRFGAQSNLPGPNGSHRIFLLRLSF